MVHICMVLIQSEYSDDRAKDPNRKTIDHIDCIDVVFSWYVWTWCVSEEISCLCMICHRVHICMVLIQNVCSDDCVNHPDRKKIDHIDCIDVVFSRCVCSSDVTEGISDL